MKKVIIAAIAKDSHGMNVIGLENKIPWYIPEDLKHFAQSTKHHPLIMGYDTFLSVLEGLKDKTRFLAGRTSIILSRKRQDIKGVRDIYVARSLEEAFSIAEQDCHTRGVSRTYIAGGQSVYYQTIDLADELDITHVHGTFKGNRFFPQINGEDWKEVSREPHFDDGYCFTRYQKKR